MFVPRLRLQKAAPVAVSILSIFAFSNGQFPVRFQVPIVQATGVGHSTRFQNTFEYKTFGVGPDLSVSDDHETMKESVRHFLQTLQDSTGLDGKSIKNLLIEAHRQQFGSDCEDFDVLVRRLLDHFKELWKDVVVPAMDPTWQSMHKSMLSVIEGLENVSSAVKQRVEWLVQRVPLFANFTLILANHLIKSATTPVPETPVTRAKKVVLSFLAAAQGVADEFNTWKNSPSRHVIALQEENAVLRLESAELRAALQQNNELGEQRAEEQRQENAVLHREIHTLRVDCSYYVSEINHYRRQLDDYLFTGAVGDARELQERVMDALESANDLVNENRDESTAGEEGSQGEGGTGGGGAEAGPVVTVHQLWTYLDY